MIILYAEGIVTEGIPSPSSMGHRREALPSQSVNRVCDCVDGGEDDRWLFSSEGGNK